MSDPAFILIEPQMGENIGAAARGMWNFGLRHMRITSPRDGWPNTKAVAMASGAGSLLDEAMVVGTTAEAVADINYLYATTARPREMTKTVFTSEGAAQDMARRIGVGEKVFEYTIGLPFFGGATENWFAYVLALIFLVFRPQGLFGEKIIERV